MARFILDDQWVIADLDARLFTFITRDGRLRAFFYMPGTGDLNLALPVDGFAGSWDYNGDKYNPTFSPSIITEYRGENIRIILRNHVFIREGMIQYLPDCTHEYAGKTIPLPRLREWPDWAKYW